MTLENRYLVHQRHVILYILLSLFAIIGNHGETPTCRVQLINTGANMYFTMVPKWMTLVMHLSDSRTDGSSSRTNLTFVALS